MKKKKGSRARRKDKAEQWIEKLPLTYGSIPNPSELKFTVMPENIIRYRYMRCPNYEECLNAAGLADWKSLSCRACDVFRNFADPRTCKPRPRMRYPVE
jgi:hypothetical protein